MSFFAEMNIYKGCPGGGFVHFCTNYVLSASLCVVPFLAE